MKRFIKSFPHFGRFGDWFRLFQRFKVWFFLIQDILYFKVYLVSNYLSYCPPSCPLGDLPVVLAYFQSMFLLHRRLSLWTGIVVGCSIVVVELRSKVDMTSSHTLSDIIGPICRYIPFCTGKDVTTAVVQRWRFRFSLKWRNLINNGPVYMCTFKHTRKKYHLLPQAGGEPGSLDLKADGLPLY